MQKNTYGINRSAVGWESKFKRLRSEHVQYRNSFEETGKDGDDCCVSVQSYIPALHDLEKGYARYTLPGAISSEISHDQTVQGRVPSSSRQLAQQIKTEAFNRFATQQKKQHESLLSVLKSSNKQKEVLVGLLAKVVESMKKKE